MRAVIFDMDGVIIDSEPLHKEHLRGFLIEMGVSRPEKFQKNLKGVSAMDIWTALIDEFDLNYELDVLVINYRQSYLSYLKSLKTLPEIAGSTTAIKAFYKAGYKLALASSASPKRIELFLDKLHISSFFPVIVSGDDVVRSKPAPDIFLLAANKLGAKPSDCIVIEDAENGVRAAKAAGMKCIAYGGSEHNTDDLSQADLVIKDFAVLVKALRKGKLPIL